MTPRAWKRLFSRALLWGGIVIGGILLLFLASTTWHVYTKEREARQAHLDAQEALADLKARQASLTAQINSLDSSRGMEQVVRERYPVAKSGEEVIVLTNNPNEAGNAGPQATSTFWTSFLSWFSWF